MSICAGCHQLSGDGMEGLAPPLVDSEWVTGSVHRLALIALHGIKGRLTVKGKTWSLDMPGLGAALDDEQLSAVLTYVRREWQHTAEPVSPAELNKFRASSSSRTESWTEKELLRNP